MPLNDERDRAVAALRFRALGDETRLRLLHLLADGERCVSDLMELTELGQSLVSHHLRTLRQAGLVHSRPEGRLVFYSLSVAAVDATIDVLASLVEEEGGLEA
jgi:DNA-binding transcriptional ArsR family regulator